MTECEFNVMCVSYYITQADASEPTVECVKCTKIFKMSEFSEHKSVCSEGSRYVNVLFMFVNGVMLLFLFY